MDEHRDKSRWLQDAQAGTVFMDEGGQKLGKMSLRMQALLLRFLETGERIEAERSLSPVGARPLQTVIQDDIQ